jgi:hypothetical protein
MCKIKIEIVILIPHALALHRSVVPIFHCLLVPSWTQRGRRRTRRAHTHGGGGGGAVLFEIAKEDADQKAEGKEDGSQGTIYMDVDQGKNEP